ncbi:MAG: hypothetical protein JRH09_16815 [Deltaproteobacteria bacterium]|nr:hypothetical protein [Deltaproteobacteria bacterium]
MVSLFFKRLRWKPDAEHGEYLNRSISDQILEKGQPENGMGYQEGRIP